MVSQLILSVLRSKHFKKDKQVILDLVDINSSNPKKEYTCMCNLHCYRILILSLPVYAALASHLVGYYR